MALIVNSTSGLADRLFTLHQVQHFKEATGIDYVFLFNKQLESCDDFQEYFHIDDDLNVDIRNVDTEYVNAIVKSKVFDGKPISDFMDKNIPDSISNIEYLKTNNIYIKCWKGVNNLPVIDGNWWSGDFLDMHLHPSSKIQNEMDSYMSDVDWMDNVPIGMHIRRTDYTYCIENSPDFLFTNKIEELIQKDSSTRFFLCTDDPILKNCIQERYGQDKILTRNVRPRKTIGGFWDATMDMFLMSKCRELYGCARSGFVHMSSRIGHINLTRLRI